MSGSLNSNTTVGVHDDLPVRLSLSKLSILGLRDGLASSQKLCSETVVDVCSVGIREQQFVMLTVLTA